MRVSPAAGIPSASRALVSIQYLRGLAALAVVAEHTYRTHTELGRAGVDIFFVVSGFIMVHVSAREQSPVAFLRARAARIAPPYWLMTLVAAAVLRVTDRMHVLLSLAFWPHVAPSGLATPVVVQGWTLNLEAQFYALFAATLPLAERRRLPVLTGAIVALVAASVAASCLRGVGGSNFFPIALEFPAGAWLCHAWRRGWLRRLPAGSLLAAGLSLLLAQAGWPQPGPWRCLLWGLPALSIVAGAVGLEEKERLPAVPGLRALGDASYSLYLTHFLLLAELEPVLARRPAAMAVPAGITACVALGLLAHRLVERPLARALRRVPASSRGG